MSCMQTVLSESLEEKLPFQSPLAGVPKILEGNVDPLDTCFYTYHIKNTFETHRCNSHILCLTS